jgi:16S rRNA (cytosine1402-N4)-methyltransferase
MATADASALGLHAEFYHTPVLLAEVLAYLMPPGDFDGGASFHVVDGTAGEGGHSLAFARRMREAGRRFSLAACDKDGAILKRAKMRLLDARLEAAGLLEAKFVEGDSLDEFLRMKDAGEGTDRVLLDLGVSLYHYRAGGRGFSFNAGEGCEDEPLDMRLSGEGRSAGDIVASYSERQLGDMLYANSGETNSFRIARAICEARKRSPIGTAGQLAEIVRRAAPVKYRGVDSATKTFAALRIEVNGELKTLGAMIEAAACVLNAGGRLLTISFHSEEDKIVKGEYRRLALLRNDSDEPIFRILTKKPVGPGARETRENPPSRSAKLRVLEKIRSSDG